jgi:hypothetical protein
MGMRDTLAANGIDVMTVHLIKLCVGLDTLSDLAAWQAQRLRILKDNKQRPELVHVTRHMPKRAQEVLDGGSLYWVIGGWIAARQKMLELRPVEKDGLPHCALVYGPELIAVHPRPRRPFQGWRYFDPKDAPLDVATRSELGTMPDEMRRELTSLGLL